jgi:hypothetical protein
VAMKITKKYLQNIIKEELKDILQEGECKKAHPDLDHKEFCAENQSHNHCQNQPQK